MALSSGYRAIVPRERVCQQSLRALPWASGRWGEACNLFDQPMENLAGSAPKRKSVKKII